MHNTLLQTLLGYRNLHQRNTAAIDFIDSFESVKDLGVLYYWLKWVLNTQQNTNRRVKFIRKALARIYDRCVCNSRSIAAALAFSRKAGIVLDSGYLAF